MLDATPMMFDTIKEEIMDLIDKRVNTFRGEIVGGQIEARSPSFREFKAYGDPSFFGSKDPITR